MMMRCFLIVVVAVAVTVAQPLDTAAHAASSSALCDATKLTGSVWTSSWWREPNQHPSAEYIYNVTAHNTTHFSVTSTSPAPGWWHKGPAWGVFNADFVVTGRLSISFPAGGAHINASIVDQAACAVGHTEIWLDNKSVWCQGLKPGSVTCGTGKQPPEPAPVEQVFIVFSTHLDVGYTINKNGSCAGAVGNQWFGQLLDAVDTAEQFRQKHPQWRYQWMIHSWIASVFRHCATSPINIEGPGYPSDLVCPSAANLSAFAAGVKAGDIGWHAFPFNGEPEVYGASLFSAAFNLTFVEDEYYGRPHTITYSQRDVPGLTRGAIPVLVEAGVKGVSVGMNPSVPPVNVPDIFRWRDNASDTEVVALFHKRGYGGCFNCGNGDGHAVLHASDCVKNLDSRTAICYSWRSDNSGPHSYTQAVSIFESAQRMFPSANITAIDALDGFIGEVAPHINKLPLVTAEIGDTWIQGASSDPLKVALFRSASRQRAMCMAAANCEPAASSLAFKDFERLLMKVGEHTWGWNGGDTRNGGWSNADFAVERKSDPQYATAAKTWQEQRAFVPNAVAALGEDSALRRAILAEWGGLVAVSFDEVGFEVVSALQVFACGDVWIGFDAATGGISTLHGPGGTSWASSAEQLAQPWYQNVNYTQAHDSKPGLNLTALNSTAKLIKLQRKVGANDTSFKLTMTMPDHDVHVVRGAPALLEALVVVPHAKDAAGGNVDIAYTLQWFNKTATKAPETIWLLNKPAVQDATAWRLHKLGAMINPLDADLSIGAAGASAHCNPTTDGRSGATCGVHLHTIDSGAYYSGREGTLKLASLDSMLVSVGDPLPSPAPFTVPEPLGGVHFSLVDNTWNTNYPEWYPFIEATATAFPGGEGDENSRFRFVISIT
jgi:hypothetical protein